MAEPLLINVGCGNVWHPRWANLDPHPAAEGIKPYRACARLPFTSQAADAIYIPRLLDILPGPRAVRLLQEARRVLKPGGVIRVVALDLESLCKAYLAQLGTAAAGNPVESGTPAAPAWRPRDARSRCDEAPGPAGLAMLLPDWTAKLFGRAGVAARSAREPVPAIYDRHRMARLLSRCGFGSIEIVDAGTSGIPGFFRMELDTVGAQARLPNLLYVEARPKPASEAATLIRLAERRFRPGKTAGAMPAGPQARIP